MNKLNKLAVGVGTTLLLSNIAFAATSDGEVEDAVTGSTGTADITASVPPLISVTGFEAMNLTYSGGVAAPTDTNDLCVRLNGNTTYELTATGSGTSSAFTMAGSAGNTDVLAYTVSYDSVDLTAGTAKAGLVLPTANKNLASLNCSDTGSVTKELKTTLVLAGTTGAHTVAADDYVGILTVTVSPD